MSHTAFIIQRDMLTDQQWEFFQKYNLLNKDPEVLPQFSHFKTDKGWIIFTLDGVCIDTKKVPSYKLIREGEGEFMPDSFSFPVRVI